MKGGNACIFLILESVLNIICMLFTSPICGAAVVRISLQKPMIITVEAARPVEICVNKDLETTATVTVTVETVAGSAKGKAQDKLQSEM